MPNRWQKRNSPRGWRQEQDLSRLLWSQLLRGPRPPSVQWPRARGNGSTVGNQGAQGRQGDQQRKHGQESRQSGQQVRSPAPARVPPEEAQAAAEQRVQRLEAVLEAFGGAESADTEMLRKMIGRAKAQAKIPSVADCIKGCEVFLNRATKRLQVAESEVEKAIEKKKQMESEVAEGQSRLARLRAEMLRESHPPPPPPDVEAEVQRLRDQIAQLQSQLQSQTTLRVCRVSGSASLCVSAIPPMPDTVERLRGWLSDRNSELRDALEFADPATTAVITDKLARGAEKLSKLQSDMSDDEYALRTVPGEGRFAPY